MIINILLKLAHEQLNLQQQVVLRTSQIQKALKDVKQRMPSKPFKNLVSKHSSAVQKTDAKRLLWSAILFCSYLLFLNQLWSKAKLVYTKIGYDMRL